MAVTLYGISITTSLAVANGVLRNLEAHPMPSALPVGRHPAGAGASACFPSVTTWNRLEARPRTHELRPRAAAEVRDALWMLTKQWQMGEFRGSDAGSPVFAKLQIDTTRLTKYRPDAQADPAVRARRAARSQGRAPAGAARPSPAGRSRFDLRLAMGRAVAAR